MPYTRQIICLAASRKHLGYCYAGKDSGNGQWVRPVSARQGHEISDFERTLLSGARAAVLDVIEVSLLQPQPHTFQSENHLNNPAVRWQKVGTATYADAMALLDNEAPLWSNGPSSYNGLHDQIPEEEADGLQDSLRLIRVTDLNLLVHSEGGVYAPAKRAVRARFEFLGETYWLKLTDPVLDAELKQEPDGEHIIPEAILTVSLGETFNGFAYKLAASIITP